MSMRNNVAFAFMGCLIGLVFCPSVIAQSYGGSSRPCLTYKNISCPTPGQPVDCSVNRCTEVITYEGGSGGTPVKVIRYICEASQQVNLKAGSYTGAAARLPGESADGIYTSPLNPQVYCAEVRACSNTQVCAPENRFCHTLSTGGYGTPHYSIQIYGVCP